MQYILLILLGLGGLVYFLDSQYPDALGSMEQQISLTHSILLLVFVGSTVLLGYRGKWHHAAKHILIWLMIIGAIVVAYTLGKDHIDPIARQVKGELVPSAAMENPDGTITLRKAADGHFYMDGQINNQPVRFMVDTGATDTVIDRDVVERIGINTENLRYTKIYNTANGIVRGAPIRLQEIQAGPLVVRDVRASVNEADLSHPLLGMSFLERLSGYNVRGDTLTLIP